MSRIDYLERLAGRGDVDAVIRAELAQAGIEAVEGDLQRGEIPTTVQGRIASPHFAVKLERAWVYWMASISPTLPGRLAVALNDAPIVGSRSRYNGDELRLGAVVRAEGYSGGQASEALKGGVSHWHIDTPEGLEAFAKWVRENLTENVKGQAMPLKYAQGALRQAIEAAVPRALNPKVIVTLNEEAPDVRSISIVISRNGRRFYELFQRTPLERALKDSPLLDAATDRLLEVLGVKVQADEAAEQAIVNFLLGALADPNRFTSSAVE